MESWTAPRTLEDPLGGGLFSQKRPDLPHETAKRKFLFLEISGWRVGFSNFVYEGTKFENDDQRYSHVPWEIMFVSGMLARKDALRKEDPFSLARGYR